MTDDRTLIEALRTAGHDEAANVLRDKSLATQLRDAGHDTLAAQLDGSPPAEPPAPKSPRDQEAEAIGQALRDAGLLDK